MTAETLFTAAMNDRLEYNAVIAAVHALRRAIDSTASRVARENAAWHDDPEADDHAEFHAPAIEQFPRAVRDAAIVDLVRHYLGEITLSENSV